jgi:uncharacterized protein involved in cysteine biosynthesis
MIRSLWYGLTLPFRAGKLIVTKPVLLFWSMLPVALTLSLYGFVVLRLQHLARDALTRQFTAWGWDAHGWGAFTLGLLAQLGLILVSALTFSAVASVISSPFNDFLAERTERFAEPALPSVKKPGFAGKLRLILIDLGKSLAAAFAMVVAILMSWVPLLNLLAFGVAFLLVSFQYISYPQTRRGLGIGDGLKFLAVHPFACLGFGATLTLLFSIPLVSSLCFPLAVVGGTLLVARGQRVAGVARLY